MPAQTKTELKESFKHVRSIEPIYTGGKVAVSPDEQWLFTSLGDQIQVMELETGRPITSLHGDTEVITSFCISPDFKHLITCSQSNLMRTYVLPSFELIRTQRAHDAPVFVCDIDSTSALFASGSADSVIRVWDIAKGFVTHNFRGHSGRISALKFHLNQHKWTLISGAEDAHICIWDLINKECVAVLESHVSVIRGLDFTPDGDTLISGSRDQVVNVWNLKTNKLILTIPVYDTIETVGFVRDNVFFTAGENGKVKLWNISSGNSIQESDQGDSITDVVKLPASNSLMIVTTEQDLYTLSLSSDLAKLRYIVGYNDEIVDCKYLDFFTGISKNSAVRATDDVLVPPDASHHLVVATNSKTIRVYDMEKWDCQMIHGHTDTVICMDTAPLENHHNRVLLASGGKDKSARVWVVELSDKGMLRYACAAICTGHADSISALSLTKQSTGKHFLLTASQDRTIKCWDVTAPVNVVGEQQDVLSSIPSPHSMYTNRAHEKEINSVTISPNDRFFATASQDRTAKLWAIDDGKHLGTFIGHKRSVWDVQFSPMDPCIATASGDKTIKIWNMGDFSCIKTFEGHTNSVLRVCFLSKGAQLVSSGSDGLVKVWTIKTNECVTTLDKHEDRVWGLCVRSDERVVVSGGADSLITFWEDVTAEEAYKKRSDMEELISKEQDFANFVQKKDWKNAIILSLSLEQPYRLLTMFKNVARQVDENNILGNKDIEMVLMNLSDHQVELLLSYVRDWNTNAKHAQVAQNVLKILLSHYPSSKLCELSGIKAILEGLLPYSERHFERMDRLTTESYIVEHTLSGMDALLDG